jgi:hypothetical protein
MDTNRKKSRDTAQGGCAKAKASRRLRYLVGTLIFACFVWGVWWTTEAYKDNNRYELYPFFGFEATAAYKLDKKTGKVTAIWNLQEFEVEPYEGSGLEAQFQYQNRSTTLLD